MSPRAEQASLRCPRCGRSREWLVIVLVVLVLAACAAPRTGQGQSPRVFDLATVPPKTVPAGCPVTVSFQTESPTELVHVKVTWQLTRITGKRVVVDHWYAILPIPGEGSRSRGIVAFQLKPREEGTYGYAVEVTDTEGLMSNILRTTVIVQPREHDTPCPSADPTLRPRSMGVCRRSDFAAMPAVLLTSATSGPCPSP